MLSLPCCLPAKDEALETWRMLIHSLHPSYPAWRSRRSRRSGRMDYSNAGAVSVSFGSRSQPVMDYIAQATSAVSQKTDCKDLKSSHVYLGITGFNMI